VRGCQKGKEGGGWYRGGGMGGGEGKEGGWTGGCGMGERDAGEKWGRRRIRVAVR